MDAVYEVMTDKSVEAAVAAIKVKAKEFGFGALWELNFQDKIEEKGFHLDKIFYLIDLCNPKLASAMLQENIELGYVLPCKVVVYEKNNQNYIGLLKPTMLVDLIDQSFSEQAKMVEENLIKILEMSR